MSGAHQFPTVRRRIFDPPPELASMRGESGGICPVRLPDGGEGWLATGHAEVSSALADERWSARPELRAADHDGPAPDPAAPGFFVRMDGAEHARYRRLVARSFSQRRIREIAPAVVTIVDAHLDRLASRGTSADLVAELGLPVPAAVVGLLLGIDDDLDAEAFAAASGTAVDLEAPPEQIAAAFATIRAMLARLVDARRRRPGPGLVGELIAAGELSDEEIVAMSLLLLVAGHETTSSMLGLAAFALLCHPGERARFERAVDHDPALDASFDTDLSRAVDELLRYLTVNAFGAMRIASTALVVNGMQVPPGTPLVCSLAAANRDPARFEEPDRLDLARRDNPHLAFGHGPHLCSGRQLARLELQIMLGRLWRRFPGLELAVAPNAVPLRLGMSVYGVRELPVRW